jgi:hypothetical protein
MVAHPKSGVKNVFIAWCLHHGTVCMSKEQRMKQRRRIISRRTLLKRGAALLGLTVAWRALPAAEPAHAQAGTRLYGPGLYGAGLYGRSQKVYLPVVTR